MAVGLHEGEGAKVGKVGGGDGAGLGGYFGGFVAHDYF